MFHPCEDVMEQFQALKLEQTAIISKIYEILEVTVRACGEKTVLCFFICSLSSSVFWFYPMLMKLLNHVDINMLLSALQQVGLHHMLSFIKIFEYIENAPQNPQWKLELFSVKYFESAWRLKIKALHNQLWVVRLSKNNERTS